MSTTIYRSFTIRLYPTKKQEEIFWKHINNCRFVWNYMLSVQKQLYKSESKYLSAHKMCKLLTSVKQTECNFLYEVSNSSLQIVCRDLDFSYSQYFKHISGLPSFKKKRKAKKSYPIREERFYFIDDKRLHIEKVGKVKYKINYDYKIPVGFNNKFVNPRVKYINNKWILTFGIMFDNENQIIQHNDISVGIDLGIKEQAVIYTSNYQTFTYHNINKSCQVRHIKERIKKLNNSLNRKYIISKNMNKNKIIKSRNALKEEQRLRKLYYKLSCVRLNYIHQITNQIIKLNPYVVIMEDLKVQQMMKNKYLSPYIHEQNFNTFKYIMQYKCEFNGIKFVLADKYFPSSKQCSNCKHIKKDLQLSDRTYVCECCGNIIDRDLNAARNLSRYDFHLEENQS